MVSRDVVARTPAESPLSGGEQGHPGKALTVGIEGSIFTILKSLSEDGRVRTFASMTCDEELGTLESTNPLDNAPAWSSFAAGENHRRPELGGRRRDAGD